MGCHERMSERKEAAVGHLYIRETHGTCNLVSIDPAPSDFPIDVGYLVG